MTAGRVNENGNLPGKKAVRRGRILPAAEYSFYSKAVFSLSYFHSPIHNEILYMQSYTE